MPDLAQRSVVRIVEARLVSGTLPVLDKAVCQDVDRQATARRT